jgi:hypothetical protein
MGSWTVWARVFFTALIVLVTYFTLVPDPDAASKGLAFARWISETIFRGAIPHDKVEHFLAYTALGAAAFFAQIRLFNNRYSVPLVLALYGGLLEVVQGLGGVRFVELADGVANTIGAYIGYGGSLLLAAFVRTRAA